MIRIRCARLAGRLRFRNCACNSPRCLGETSLAITAAELERTMKVQEAILKAMAHKITWLESSVCNRSMRRMGEWYQEFGYERLFDQRRRKRSITRVSMEQAERVLALYRETYFDLNVKHFDEKLREDHAIELSYTWVKQALQGAGLASPALAQKTNAGHAATHRWQQASVVFR